MLLWGLAAGDVYAKGMCCGGKEHGKHAEAKGHGDHEKAGGNGDREKAATHGKHEKAEKPTLPRCPVMGDPIDFSVHTRTDDGPVYFCCEGCIKKFKANPGKYAAKVAGQRRALKALPRVQVSCPLTGRPVQEDVSIERDGRKVYFCCKGCPPKFLKDPARYKARLEAGYTYQTRCPVMGGEIDPAAYVDLAGGHRVYFCCKGCDKKFLKDPARYVAKLEAQGIHLDPTKVRRAKTGASKAKTHAKQGHGSHDH